MGVLRTSAKRSAEATGPRAEATPRRGVRAASGIARLGSLVGNSALGRLMRERLDVVRAELGRAGEPLAPDVRADMEQRLGERLPDVRVHRDSRAPEAVNAKAFAAGKHVVLGPQVPPATTDEGRRVLAHELAHVLQQPRLGSLGVLPPGAPAERAAAAAETGGGAGAAPLARAGVARLLTEKDVTRMNDDELRTEYDLVTRELGQEQSGPDHDAAASYLEEIEQAIRDRQKPQATGATQEQSSSSSADQQSSSSTAEQLFSMSSPQQSVMPTTQQQSSTTEQVPGVTYNTALSLHQWSDAARALSDMSDEDRQASLEALDWQTREHLRDAAARLDQNPDNPLVSQIESMELPATTSSETSAGPPPLDPSQFRTFDEFNEAAPAPYDPQYLKQLWDASHPPESTNDIIVSIAEIEKPGDVAEFWASQARPHREDWADPLSELEQNYIDAFRDPTTPKVLQMRVPVDPANLTDEEREAAERLFGTGADAAQRYANYENRRRILAHYVYTHPATVRAELGVYRLFRDANPIHFALERGWQIGGGKEMFTGEDVSRLGAAGEFLLAIGTMYGVGKAMEAVRPTPQFGMPTGPARALTDPIYDLPEEGGGMNINGRWYTEHALERMAPDTAEVRAEMTTRVQNRLERLGIKPDNPAYSRVLAKALSKVDPRGIPPSVVEAEILKPGSTSVRVITAKGGRIVVTVMPRHTPKVTPAAP